MNLENLIKLIFLPLLVHAGLMFFQSFRKGPSQYDDLLGIQINNLKDNMKVQELLDVKLCNRLWCKDLLAGVIVWSKCLRIIGLLPFLLYFIYFFLLFTEGVFKEQVDIELLFYITFVVAIVFQLLYILLKFYSNIPELLRHLHKDYKNSSFLPILFDIIPLWKRSVINGS